MAAVEGQDRVLAMAQQIVKSLNINTKATEDMILILSNFDNRLSNITDLIGDEESGFTSAENIILRRQDSGNLVVGESDEYLLAVDTIIKLTETSKIQSSDTA